MAGIQNDSGVSVIIGTLLLILITVTAAAGLAIMVSQMQKDEMNRQTHLTAVKSEKIEILNIHLNNDPVAWNQSPFNITENQSWNNWSSITLTLSNMNTDTVKVIGIAINDRYARNYSTVTDTPYPERIPYNISNAEYLTLTGTKSQKVQINFTDDFSSTQYIPTDNQVRIRIMTSLYNTFEKIIKPPNPVIQTKIETDNLGTVNRDALILDGSQSTADSTILMYNWIIYDLSYTTPPGNLTDTSNWTIYNQTFSGKTVRTSELNNTQYYRVSLTISDALGMSAASATMVSLPPSQFNPPTYMNLYLDNGTEAGNITTFNLTATVKDINNHLLDKIPVTFIIRNDPNTNSCFSLNTAAMYTDSSGNATVSVSQKWITSSCNAVTVFAQSGKLVSQDKIIPKVDIH